jgi:hypothetical protein
VKAECERCHEQVDLSFAPATGGIDVTCPSCKATYFVPSEASPPASSRPGPDEQECPKCGLVQPRADACRRCGLIFVRWKGGAAEDTDGSDAERREAAALWAACEAAWDDSARHDAFIAYCQRTAQFPYAAGRYRATQSARGAAAEPAASRGLERIEKLAVASLELAGAARRAGGEAATTPYKGAMVMIVLALFLLAGGLLWAIFYQDRRGGRGDDIEERVVPVRVQPKKP